CHTSSPGQVLAFGRSFGSPSGAPASTQRAIRSICWSESDRSLANFWIPTVLSTYHGGMSRPTTLVLIDLTHGRTSLKFEWAIGAMPSAGWQISHFSWKIGGMSLARVTESDRAARFCAWAGAIAT